MERLADPVGRLDHRLVRDAVDEEMYRLLGAAGADRDDVTVRIGGRHPVVRRPQVGAGRSLADEQQHADHRRSGDRRPHGGAASEGEEHKQDGGRGEPGDRLETERRHEPEAGDPRQRAGDVDGVRPQRRHRPQQPAERQRERGHQRDDEAHQHWQHDEVRVGALVRVEPEEDLVARVDRDVQLGAQHEEHEAEQEQREGREPQGRPARPRRMPSPMPRKLAISRKLLKKPT